MAARPETPGGTVAAEDLAEKGLKPGVLGLVSSVVVGVASTAPAYSLAATLGVLVVAVGVMSPTIVVLAFVPMLLVSIGYSELNKADPDCGTIFTWATRTFGPWVGWMGGWGIIAADVLVMASLGQVSGQYGFLLIGADRIGHDPTSEWVLIVGVGFIVALTYTCYRGIELSVRVQRVLLSIEVFTLLVFSAVALARVALGNAPAGHVAPSWHWFDLSDSASFSKIISGLVLMLFIYWGWDTAVSVNEETTDKERNPGLAAIISTVLLLITFFLVTLASQSFAGVGSKGAGLANPNNRGDVLSGLGSSVFGRSWVGVTFSHLLILMVLSSAAASTQTCILQRARTALSMAAYKALPDAFGRVHKRFQTPTVSTVAMGAVSVMLYVAFNHVVGGDLIPDSVTAIAVWIAFYYGLTGFTCAWYYRKVLMRSRRDLCMKGVLPALGGTMLYFALGWSLWTDWSNGNGQAQGSTSWHLPFPPHSDVGGVLLIALASALVGALAMALWRLQNPTFFQGRTLRRSSATADLGTRAAPCSEAEPVMAWPDQDEVKSAP